MAVLKRAPVSSPTIQIIDKQIPIRELGRRAEKAFYLFDKRSNSSGSELASEFAKKIYDDRMQIELLRKALKERYEYLDKHPSIVFDGMEVALEEHLEMTLKQAKKGIVSMATEKFDVSFSQIKPNWKQWAAGGVLGFALARLDKFIPGIDKIVGGALVLAVITVFAKLYNKYKIQSAFLVLGNAIQNIVLPEVQKAVELKSPILGNQES